MIKIGSYNKLKVLEVTQDGAFLDGGEAGEIFLLKKELPPKLEAEQDLEVFVYVDSDDYLVATTARPLAEVGQCAVLKINSIDRVGAFLEWGLPKELLLPFAEQTRDLLKAGDHVVVFVYLDNTDRIAASMRLQRHLSNDVSKFKVGQEVDLIVVAKTDLGYKAVVSETAFGMLYSDEVFKPLRYGEKLKGFIKTIRPDKKIDLALSQPGHKAAQEEITPKILEELKNNSGFLAVTDKSSAEEVHRLFGVSRKKFKIALGGLYKQRLIVIEKDGIRLVEKQKREKIK